MIKKFVLFLLVWSIFPLKSIAQDIRFKHLTINDGLSQNAIFAIAQDADGYMWFGTKDGLNKYNGYTFTIYQHDPNNKSTLSANYITALFSDSFGNLWVGTENGVLNRYNKITNSFQRISLPLTSSLSKNSSEIKKIIEGNNGIIWVGTSENGIFKIPLFKNAVQENAIKQFYDYKTKTYNLTNNSVSDLYVDTDKMIWIANKKGLIRMNVKTEEFTSFIFDVKHPSAPKGDLDFAATSIFPTEDGFLWLGTLSGLVKFNTNNFSYTFYPHHLNIFRYGWGVISKIVEDSKQNLWLSTPAELMHFNTKTNTYTYYKNDPDNPESLSYNSVSSLFIDKSNIVWLGTSGMGINYFDPKAYRFSLLDRKEDKKSRITGFSIRAILEENDRYLWVSSDVLYRWDRKTNLLKSFETSSNNLDAFGNTGAWSMIKTQDGNLWFATTEGLYVYDPASGETKQFKYEVSNLTGIPKKNVRAVYEDNKGILWIITGNFLSKMTDRKNGVFKHFQYFRGSSINQYERPVLLEDGDAKMWLGTANGLLLFDKAKESFHTYQNQPDEMNSLINNSILSISPDAVKPERYTWIGTSGGLELFDKKEQAFTHFTEKDGLPNNVVYGILNDAQNNLWLSTNKGISKFNPSEKTFRNFDVQDGLQSNEFNKGAYFRSQKGELFFGGISGLTYFFPDQIKNNTFQPSVVLTGLKVYNRSKNNGAETFIDIPINDNKELTFTHDDDIITFEFAALDFSAPLKNQYAYQLENFQNNWIPIGHNRTATFTNLPPGKYNLKVKGSNNDGVWNEKGISIPIRILPHWTSTWWAYIIYLLLFLTLLYFIRRYELNRILIKNQLKVERIEFDTLRGIDQLKSRFFANISHELRTPLTLISGQAESLLNELKSKQSRTQIKAIDRNAKRLLQLINELLDLSKLEAGKMQLNLTQNNMVIFLKNLFYSFELLSVKKNITLNFISEGENIQTVFDEEKMEKIISNLLYNAFKFTPENGGITLKIENNNTETLKISIIDTGIGISEENLPHIFDRFYQVENSDTRSFEGTGIGLALAKEMIELHHGSIQVYRNEMLIGQKGTTFTLEFPIGNVIENTDENCLPKTIKPKNGFKSEVAAQQPIVQINPNKKIIVLVEDNEDIRYFVKLQLQQNYQIVEAINGEEGIQKAQKLIPDLIITDVMMPKMDGFTMVKTLRNDEKTSHIPIIMLTGKASHDDKIEGLETGVDAFLTKPFNCKELQLRITNLIQQRELLSKKYKNTFAIVPEELSIESLDQQFLEKVIYHIQQNIDNTLFSVELLAENMCLSVSQLHRKLQAIINQAPGQLLRNMRLQKAADLIKQNAGSITDICFQTGFNDQAYFSRAFKNQFGCSPSSYKKEYS